MESRAYILHADLQRAAGILHDLFTHPMYNAWIESRNRCQSVMVGYSDSAKDGG
jgi:phosphoenolpyruvate carboxylase